MTDLGCSQSKSAEKKTSSQKDQLGSQPSQVEGSIPQSEVVYDERLDLLKQRQNERHYHDVYEVPVSHSIETLGDGTGNGPSAEPTSEVSSILYGGPISNGISGVDLGSDQGIFIVATEPSAQTRSILGSDLGTGTTTALNSNPSAVEVKTASQSTPSSTPATPAPEEKKSLSEKLMDFFEKVLDFGMTMMQTLKDNASKLFEWLFNPVATAWEVLGRNKGGALVPDEEFNKWFEKQNDAIKQKLKENEEYIEKLKAGEDVTLDMGNNNFVTLHVTSNTPDSETSKSSAPSAPAPAEGTPPASSPEATSQ